MAVDANSDPSPIAAFRHLAAEYQQRSNACERAALEWSKALAHARNNGQGGPAYPNFDQIEAEALRQERRIKEGATLVRQVGERFLKWASSQGIDDRPLRRYLSTLHAADLAAVEAMLERHEQSKRDVALRELAQGPTSLVNEKTLPTDESTPREVVPTAQPQRTTEEATGTDRPVVDRSRFQVTWRGSTCAFGNRRVLFYVIEILLQRPGHYVGFETLKQAWGGSASDPAIRTAMKDLRELLRGSGMGGLAEGLHTAKDYAILELPKV